MDIERLSHHHGYKTSVITAVVLSAMLVTLAAFVGRGALNLRSALTLPEPTDVTVIAVVEPRLSENSIVTRVTFLRTEKSVGDEEKPYYAYLVETSLDGNRLVRIAWGEDEWTLVTFEALHGQPTLDEDAMQEQELETPPQP